MARIMRADRSVIEVEAGHAQAIHAQMLLEMGYVQATDGLWLPKCDLAQYERGEREPIYE